MSSINYSSLPKELKRIGHDALGRGVLQSVFNYRHSYELIVKLSDGEHAGFSLYHIEEYPMQNEETYRIGVIDALCVATQLRGIGFGSQITTTTLHEMSKRKINRAEITIKRPSEEDLDTMPGVPTLGNDYFLRDLGFRKIKTFPKHYRDMSEKFGYDCGTCGNTPDNCDGVLYAINDRDHYILN